MARPGYEIRAAAPADAGEWLRMREALWPSEQAAHAQEVHGGCTEFGSDALLDNEVSAAAHAALGFEEVVQIRCFHKDVGSQGSAGGEPAR